MVSHKKYLVAVLLITIHACLGQPPMMFPGQPPMRAPVGTPMGFGGMSNPMLMPLAMSGMDFNKLMYMSMLMNGMGQGGAGMGGMGTMLPAFGLYNAFS